MASDFLALERTAQRLCDGLAGIVDVKTREELAQIRNVISSVRHAGHMLACLDEYGRDECLRELAVNLTLIKPHEARPASAEYLAPPVGIETKHATT